MDVCNFIEITCLAEYGDNTGNTDESPWAVKGYMELRMQNSWRLLCCSASIIIKYLLEYKSIARKIKSYK